MDANGLVQFCYAAPRNVGKVQVFGERSELLWEMSPGIDVKEPLNALWKWSCQYAKLMIVKLPQHIGFFFIWGKLIFAYNSTRIHI